MRDPSGAPGPQARERTEQQGLARTGLTDDEDPLARFHFDLALGQHGAAGR